MNHTCFAFPAEAGTHLMTPEGWKAELALEIMQNFSAHAWPRFRRLFFTVTSYSCKVNTTAFVILLQLLKGLEFDDNIIVIIQIKAQKFATYSINSLYALATI